MLGNNKICIENEISIYLSIYLSIYVLDNDHISGILGNNVLSYFSKNLIFVKIFNQFQVVVL